MHDWREKDEEGRRSNDQNINKEGKMLVRFLEEKRWEIFNGKTRGDGEEEYTFTERMGKVIDYIIRSEDVRDWIRKVKVGYKGAKLFTYGYTLHLLHILIF